MRAIVESYSAAFRGLPRNVWILSFVLLINRSGTMVLPFWTLYCTSERSLTPLEAGQLLAVNGIGGIFGSLLGGWLSTRIGAIRTMTASLFLTAIGFLVLLSAEQYGEMAVCLFLLSLATESFRPASATATTEMCAPDRHAQALALNRLAVNLGMTLGPAIGGVMAAFSFRWLFLFDAATCAAASLGLALYFGGRHDTEIRAAEAAGNVAPQSPLSDRVFLCFLGLVFLSGTVFFQLMGTYPLYLRDHYGFGTAVIGFMWSVNTVLIVCFEMVLVRSVRSVRSEMAVGWGCLLIGLGFGIIGLGSSVIVCLVSVLVWTVGEMLAFPLALAYVSRRTDVRSRGMYMGWYTMSFSVAFVVAPVVGTWLYQRSPSLLWLTCAVVGAVAFCGFAALARFGPAAVGVPKSDRATVRA